MSSEDKTIPNVCIQNRSEFTPECPLAYGTGPFMSSACIDQTGKESLHHIDFVSVSKTSQRMLMKMSTLMRRVHCDNHYLMSTKSRYVNKCQREDPGDRLQMARRYLLHIKATEMTTAKHNNHKTYLFEWMA